MTRVALARTLTFIIAFSLAACQGNQTAPFGTSLVPTSASIQPTATLFPVPYRSMSLSGQFVFAPGDSSIWIQDAATFEARPLVKHGQDEYYESPSFSPDGARVVFVAYTFDKEGGQVKEIRVVDADGTNGRTLFKPDPTGPRTYLGDPRYSPDGSWIYFTVSTVQGDIARTQTSHIERGPAAGGERQVVLPEGDHPSLSGDGKRLTFLRFNPQTFSSSLWVANADGSDVRQLLADDVFAGVIGQRFSPDGNWIVFAASGPPRKALPGMSLVPIAPGNQATGAESCALGLGAVCLVQPVLADGLPWDIWLVSPDGNKFEQLTKLGLDSPWPAFSKDGRYISFISTNGLFVYDRETKVTSLLDQEKAHGVMDWFQK